MVATVEGTLGPIDLLVNNASIMAPIGRDWEVDPTRWWRTLEVNLLGPYLCARAVLPLMVQRRQGHIINISSSAAYISVRASHSIEEHAFFWRPPSCGKWQVGDAPRASERVDQGEPPCWFERASPIREDGPNRAASHVVFVLGQPPCPSMRPFDNGIELDSSGKVWRSPTMEPTTDADK